MSTKPDDMRSPPIDPITATIEAFASKIAEKVLEYCKDRDECMRQFDALQSQLDDTQHDQANLSAEKLLLEEIAQLKQKNFEWRSWACSILAQPGFPPIDASDSGMRAEILRQLKATGNQ